MPGSTVRPTPGASAHPGAGSSGAAPAERPRGGRRTVHACGHEAAARVDAVVAEIRALHAALAASDDLSPGPRTDALFSRLVALAVRRRPGTEAARVLADPAVSGLLAELHRLCARGEHELERWWSRRIAAAPDAGAELVRFPYTANYRDLTRLEVHALTGHLPGPPRRVLFVGSGPLPLTSIMMAAEHGIVVDNLDSDAEAVRLGSAVAAALGARGVRFRTGDVLDADDLSGYDAVCLAALVGLEPEAKGRVLDHVRRRIGPGGLLLARSAHALRGLLYPELDVDDLVAPAGLEPLAVLHPFTDVVNSVVLARAPRA